MSARYRIEVCMHCSTSPRHLLVRRETDPPASAVAHDLANAFQRIARWEVERLAGEEWEILSPTRSHHRIVLKRAGKDEIRIPFHTIADAAHFLRQWREAGRAGRPLGILA